MMKSRAPAPAASFKRPVERSAGFQLLWILMTMAFAGPRPAGALDPAAGTGGAAFTKIGMGSARAQAMGRSLVALAEGTDALTWNPAGLALSQTREFNFSQVGYVQGVAGVPGPRGSAPTYFGYAHPLGRTVFGADFGYLRVDGFEIRDETGRKRDNSEYVVHDSFFRVAGARSFWYEKLFLGASLRGIYEDNAGARRSALAGDLGAVFRPNQVVSFGFAQQGLGGDPDQAARLTRFGAAGRIFELLTVAGEVLKPSDNETRIGIGGEFTLPEEFLSAGQISMRVGYNRGENQGVVAESERHSLYPLVGATGLSFGLGMYTSQAFGYGLGIDYSLVPMGALGNMDQITIKVRF